MSNIALYTNQPTRPLDGEIWEKLHAEREGVCQALLNDARLVGEGVSRDQEIEPAQEAPRDVLWRRNESLTVRLHQVDDALDRLFAGEYGHCDNCGQVIEERRLSADPAVLFCLECQAAAETEMPHGAL
jgi:DnaK suppressor protein